MIRTLASGLDEAHPALAALRRYLDEVGFTRVHKYVVSPERYFSSLLPAAGLDALVRDWPQLELAATLMADRPCRRDALTGLAAEAVGPLVDAGLLADEAGTVRQADLQLVSMQGVPLFVDAGPARAGAPTLPVPGPGVDSPLLAHHVDVDRISRTEPSLDLATGAGMLALFLSRHAPRVVATDDDPRRLQVAALNVALNRRAAVVELRGEDLGHAMARGERYAVVTCNPWATPFPDGLTGPLYAPDQPSPQVAGADGLGPVRHVVARVDDLLLPHGAAYLVAQLVGDAARPYFLDELERMVGDHALVADVYLEDRVDFRIQHGPLRGLANLVANQRGWDRQHVFELVQQHYRVTLAATCRFLAILVLRRRGVAAARLRVFNRFKGA